MLEFFPTTIVETITKQTVKAMRAKSAQITLDDCYQHASKLVSNYDNTDCFVSAYTIACKAFSLLNKGV